MQNIIIRQHQHKLNASIDLKNNKCTIFNHTDSSMFTQYGIIKIMSEDKGFYITNLETGEIHTLILNPFSKEYWICRDDKSLYLAPGSPLKAIVCDALKFVCFSIPRNGSSSILASAMVYDNKISMDDYKKIQGTIWPYGNLYCKGTTIVSYEEGSKIVKEKNYKGFAVLEQDRIDRYVSYLNWEYKSKLIKYFNYETNKKTFIEEHVWALPLLTNNNLSCDAHCLPSDCFVWEIGCDCEFVYLKNLPEDFEDMFNKPLLKNHISDLSEKIFSSNDLTCCALPEFGNIISKWFSLNENETIKDIFS